MMEALRMEALRMETLRMETLRRSILGILLLPHELSPSKRWTSSETEIPQRCTVTASRQNALMTAFRFS